MANGQDVLERLAQIEAKLTSQVESLEQAIDELRKKPKDRWDKFRILATLLVPASIGLVGYFVTSYQASLETKSDETIAAEDRLISARLATTAQGDFVHDLIDDMTAQGEDRQAVAFEMLGVFAPKDAKRLIDAALSSARAGNGGNGARAAAAKVVDSLGTFDVTIERIDVIADCDNFTDFEGDFFYSFFINDRLILEVPRSKTTPAHEGKDIAVDASARVSLLLTPEASLTIRGSITDKDRGTSGDDDHLGTIERVVPMSDEPWTKGLQAMEFRQSESCHAVAYYRIDRV